MDEDGENPEIIAAYQAGVPGNGKPFPDGSKMAKIHWNAKKSAIAPAPTTVPDTMHDLDFMVRDSKRFADSGNWGYGEFDYHAASDTFTHLGTGAKCGFARHSIATAKDYVFTGLPEFTGLPDAVDAKSAISRLSRWIW